MEISYLLPRISERDNVDEQVLGYSMNWYFKSLVCDFAIEKFKLCNRWDGSYLSTGSWTTMAFYRHSNDLIPERRDIVGTDLKRDEHDFQVIRRVRKFGRITKRGSSIWALPLVFLLLIYLVVSALKLHFHSEFSNYSSLHYSFYLNSSILGLIWYLIWYLA